MVAVWIILAIVADPAGPPVQVTGAGACPAAADVQGALAGLIPPRDPEVAPDVATLTDDASSVVLALRRGSGEPIGEKRLDPGLPCAERARAAAVIIAAWEARLATQATALVVQQPAPAPKPAAAVVREAPPTPSAPVPVRIEPGVSAGASINGTTLAPSGMIEVAFSRPGGTVVPAVAALFVGSHNLAVGPGDAAWRRYGLVATVASRRAWPAVWAEARTGLAFTLLDISGSSYPRNGSAVTFDPGITFGLRVGTRSPRIRWWLDALITLWPRDQEVYVQGVPGTATLPRGGALVGLGASYEGR